MKRKQLSKSEVKALNEVVTAFGHEFHKKDTVLLLDDTYYMVEGMCWFFVHEGTIIPTVKFLLSQEKSIISAVVDMGAVKFVANGADIMRPGIVSFPDVKEGVYLCVIDQNNKKPLAIGRTLVSKEAFDIQTGGKSIANIHYIGDEIWNMSL
jgi:PUA-domain protein